MDGRTEAFHRNREISIKEHRSGPRKFLFLQGPCGSFFRHIQAELRSRGVDSLRIAFNGGDLLNSLGTGPVIYTRSLDEWPDWIRKFVARHGITDVVLYGDCRPYHESAINALQQSVVFHILEEGYIRPHWITYEREGVNGNSRLMDLDLEQLDLDRVAEKPLPPEVNIGKNQGPYMWAGFLYYLAALLLTWRFPRYRSHREHAILTETIFWIIRFFTWPGRKSRARRALSQIANREDPFHLILLQLNNDSQIRQHSDFKSVVDFVEYCLREFAQAETRDTAIVFKNHPLDNGMTNLGRVISDVARQHGVLDRTFFIDSGKLVPLLERACSVVAINSTACHQSLQRGIPTLVLGRAIYNHPTIVPRMELKDFFRLRPVSRKEDYQLFARFLRSSCQINGGFYTSVGKRCAVNRLCDMVLSEADPLEEWIIADAESASQSLRA